MKAFGMLTVAVLVVIGIGVSLVSGLPSPARVRTYATAANVLTSLGCSNVAVQSVDRATAECSLSSGPSAIRVTATIVPHGIAVTKYAIQLAQDAAGTSNFAISYIYGSDWLVSIPAGSDLDAWVKHFELQAGMTLGETLFVQATASATGG